MDELWKKLLDETQGLSPERRAELESEEQRVANDPDITPAEAFQRGVKAGIKATGEEMLDRLETLAAFRAAFPKDPKTSE